MAKARIKFSYSGFNSLRRDSAVDSALQAKAEAIAKRAAAASGLMYYHDFQAVRSPSKTRSRWIVVAVSRAAKEAEARDGVLTKALRG